MEWRIAGRIEADTCSAARGLEVRSKGPRVSQGDGGGRGGGGGVGTKGRGRRKKKKRRRANGGTYYSHEGL